MRPAPLSRILILFCALPLLAGFPTGAQSADGYIACTTEWFERRDHDAYWGGGVDRFLFPLPAASRAVVVTERRSCPSSFAKANCRSIRKPIDDFVEQERSYVFEGYLHNDIEHTITVKKEDLSFVMSGYADRILDHRALTLHGWCRFE